MYTYIGKIMSIWGDHHPYALLVSTPALIIKSIDLTRLSAMIIMYVIISTFNENYTVVRKT